MSQSTKPSEENKTFKVITLNEAENLAEQFYGMYRLISFNNN